MEVFLQAAEEVETMAMAMEVVPVLRLLLAIHRDQREVLRWVSTPTIFQLLNNKDLVLSILVSFFPTSSPLPLSHR